MMQRAKIAGLKAEAELIKRTKDAELEVQLLHMERKIRKAEAMERVYTQSIDQEEDIRKKDLPADNQPFRKQDVQKYQDLPCTKF